MATKFDPPVDIPHDEEFEWVNLWVGADQLAANVPARMEGGEQAKTAAFDALHDPRLSDDAVEPAPATPDPFASLREQTAGMPACERGDGDSDGDSDSDSDAAPAAAPAPAQADIAAASAARAREEEAPAAAAGQDEAPPAPVAESAKPHPDRLAGLYMSVRGGRLMRRKTFFRDGADDKPAHETAAPAAPGDVEASATGAPAAALTHENKEPVPAAAALSVAPPVGIAAEDAPTTAPDQLARDIAEIMEVQEALFAEPPPLALERARRSLRQAWMRMFR